jgi:hypothetical protein
MFQVIVAGGISLTGYACGNTVEVTSGGTTGSASTGGIGGFPSETGVSANTGGFGGYPMEGPVMIVDGGSSFDASADADASPGCFPEETAVDTCPDASTMASDAGDAGSAHDAGVFPGEAQ